MLLLPLPPLLLPLLLPPLLLPLLLLLPLPPLLLLLLPPLPLLKDLKTATTTRPAAGSRVLLLPSNDTPRCGGAVATAGPLVLPGGTPAPAGALVLPPGVTVTTLVGTKVVLVPDTVT